MITRHFNTLLRPYNLITKTITGSLYKENELDMKWNMNLTSNTSSMKKGYLAH